MFTMPFPRRLPPPLPLQKTPLTVTTLDIEIGCDDPKSHRDHHLHHPPPRPFRVPHNYQQYQQTILSRSFTTFTEPPADKGEPFLAICVRGEKIEGQQQQPLEGKNKNTDALKQIGSPETTELRDEDHFQMMNARGETNISFYDFQRTWSIEDYDGEAEEEEEGNAGDQRRRRLSLTGVDNKTLLLGSRYHHRRIMRPPSPTTKQIIRVNVVRVANS